MTDCVDISTALKNALHHTPKYIPSWYLYNKEGSELFERILTDNTYYYFGAAERDVLQNTVEEAIELVPSPCTLIELGSGSSKKTRVLIDILLKRQSVVCYVPVDISAEFLLEACRSLKGYYGDQLDVKMIAGDYDTGISKMRTIAENKIILWLGGFQNQSFANQVKRLRMFADAMKENDVVMMTVDVTQHASQVEDAYLDPIGISHAMYWNAFKRLNTEFGSNIKSRDLVMESKFVQDLNGNLPGRVLIRARSPRKQDISLPGLDMVLSLEEGEYINLYEGEGYSFKYTQQQLESLALSAGLTLDKMWRDPDNHVALCCFKRQ